MSPYGKRRKPLPKHPYLAGNFAPVSKTWPPTPVTWSGEIPEELHGGMYVRNGGNPVTNSDLSREVHWFDGDGMLSGVWFSRSISNPGQPIVNFVNQFIFTDVYLSAIENSELRTPILPSISTLVNPATNFLFIIWRILRSVIIVLLSHLPGSRHVIKRISVANTGIHFHDGRALATCESGPPIRVTLPQLETVGWFNGIHADGEVSIEGIHDNDDNQHPGFGGTGPLSWMREWTTGHPKVDSVTGELILFHCNFAPPYVHYSIVPTTTSCNTRTALSKQRKLNAPVPGCSGGKLMHDFGVSRHHTVILDLPLTLTPINLAKLKPILSYEPEKPARFGVFPRRHPELVRWFETSSCCVFHTANTWDESDNHGNTIAVNMLVCRLTSASLVFSAGNIVPPPHPGSKDAERITPISSIFAKHDNTGCIPDPEKAVVTEFTPLIGQELYTFGDDGTESSSAMAGVPISYDEQEQCRLYYYRFSLCHSDSNIISHQFALSAIPFEFPTVSPLTDMDCARYIYGCSTAVESFGAALGKATKIDVLVRMDIKALIARAKWLKPEPITGCVDNRTMDQILASRDPDDPIKAFKLPTGYYGQEARFVPRKNSNDSNSEISSISEASGYLLFYVFNEDQLDDSGECKPDAKSELWVLDASTMQTVICKIHLPARIPYGLHGNWFTEDQIACQQEVAALRSTPDEIIETKWSRVRRNLIRRLK